MYCRNTALLSYQVPMSLPQISAAAMWIAFVHQAVSWQVHYRQNNSKSYAQVEVQLGARTFFVQGTMAYGLNSRGVNLKTPGNIFHNDPSDRCIPDHHQSLHCHQMPTLSIVFIVPNKCFLAILLQTE